MSLRESIEHLNLLSHDHFMIGATLVGAASHLIAQEIEKTREDRARHDDRPVSDVHDSDDGDALFIVHAGLFQEASPLKDRLGPVFEHMGPTIVIEHTENNEASRAKQLEFIQENFGRRIVDICISKGGKDHIRDMADPSFREERGRGALVVNESVPYLKKHIRFMERMKMIGGLAVPDSHTAAMLLAWQMQREKKRIGNQFVRGTGTELLHDVKEGIRTLRSDVLMEEAAREAYSIEHVDQLFAISAYKDRVVNTVQSNKWLEAATGRVIPLHIDPSREPGNHAGGTEKPEALLHQIEMRLAGDYELAADLELVA
jgi:hypothetical protein